MRYFDIKKENNFDQAISYAAEIIKKGGLVAFPTETVYGLGADALNEAAVKKIFKAKGRQSDNPLIVHIADKNDVFNIAKNIPLWVENIIDMYWPGPLSIVLEKTDLIPDAVTAGLDSVAIRMPDNKAALELIKKSGGYIAAPSANTSGRPSPTKAEHVLADINDKADVILNYDNASVGLESTVIDARGEYPVILRPGAVTAEMLRKACGSAKEAYSNANMQNIPARSPGMKYTHYKPDAKVLIADGTYEETAQKINDLYKDNKNIGLFCSYELAKKTNAADVIAYNNPVQAAKMFFDMLITFDKQKKEIIICEKFEDKGIGAAINNRLLKASGNKYL